MSIFPWNEKYHGQETGRCGVTCTGCGAEQEWKAGTPGHVVLREYQAFCGNHKDCNDLLPALAAGANLNVEGARA